MKLGNTQKVLVHYKLLNYIATLTAIIACQNLRFSVILVVPPQSRGVSELGCWLGRI